MWISSSESLWKSIALGFEERKKIKELEMLLPDILKNC